MHERLIDILMITYNRPAYTRMALGRLLETCDEQMRVWLWHNGNDPQTLEVTRSFADHPRVARFHHSPENQRLYVPTNWLFTESDGAYLSKVDDDCLMPVGWADTLRAAHEQNPRFGAVGCWRFWEQDFVPELAERKIKTFQGGHRLMLNCWVEGSGFLLKRACVEELGPIGENQSFPEYCRELAIRGWVHGWYYPFLFQEHMDDPLSEHCMVRCDQDLETHAPLMAKRWGVTRVADYAQRFREEALVLQKASADPRSYYGWRKKMRGARSRLLNLARGRRTFRRAG